MSEPLFLGLSRRRPGRKSSRRGVPSQHVAAYVERLEPRWMMTVPAVDSVTKFGAVGEKIDVWGSGFTGATNVAFVQSTAPANTFNATPTVLSDSHLTVIVPNTTDTETYFDVEVTAPGGTSAPTYPGSYADVFTLASNVIPAAVAATKLTSDVVLSGGSFTLPVLATADFINAANPTPTGNLFVQTSDGVATVSYTGIDGTDFTGCTVVSGDPFHVGASATTGTIQAAYGAIFQAPPSFSDPVQTYNYTVNNSTNLPAGAQNDISYAMYWSSTGLSPTPPTYYYLNASGGYSPVSGLAVNAFLPTYPVSDSGGSITIKLPYIPTDAFRIYFGVGTPPQAEVNSGHGVIAPNDTSASSVVDFVEGTLDANGADPVVPLGVRHFASLGINTTQVDQFGMPITLTGTVYNPSDTTQDVPMPASVGVTISTNVARDAIFKQFEALHPSATDPYGTLVQSSSDPNQPLRILNPSNLSLTRSTQLSYAFDQLIKNLFETPPSLSLTTSSGVYTGVAGRDPTNNYNVLKFTGPNGPLYVYEPFFSSNSPTAPASSPVSYPGIAAPSWLQNANETPGQMVLANDGVFADANNPNASYQQPGLTAVQRTDLGAIEDDLVAALNRGVSSLPTADWGDSTKFYVTDPVFNQYASFLHTGTINGTPIFIGGKAYAIAFDDNGGLEPYLSFLNQSGVQVTLGPWQTSNTPTNNTPFLTMVYQDVLHRAVDPGGQTFWLNLLANGVSRVAVSQGIADSVEAHTDVIEGYYTTLLNRPVDPQGLSTYLSLFATGDDAAQIKSIIFGSPEYFQTHGDANAGFVSGVFQNELSRAASAGEQAAYVGYLTAGQSRIFVASLVVESPEAEQDLVQSYYQAYLGRAADPTGLAAWTALLAQRNSASLVQSGILGSDEFYSHV